MRSNTSSNGAAILTAVPQSDRARAFVGELQTLVKANYVVFARYDHGGRQIEVILDEERGNQGTQSSWLQAERLLQSQQDAALPRITDALIALDGMRGLTLVYGVDDTIFALAIVVRPRPFTPSERSLLGATLRPGSELMRRLSTFEGEQGARERTAQRAMPAQYVLSRDYQVELRWIPQSHNNSGTLETILELSEGLPPVVDVTVRRLTENWTDDPSTWDPGVAVPMSFMVVRTNPLNGPAGMKIGVVVERYRSRNSLRHAQQKFSMSPRELEVLALVLKGYGTTQIAASLDIAESTAHDHIKRMMIKTRARNRVELAAKALGWRGA